MSPCHNLEPSLVARDSSRLLSVKPNEWMHLSPFYTRMHGEWLRYAKSTSQFHWRFLLVRDVRGFQVNPLCRHDITSPFPPSGQQKGKFASYVRNLDVLFNVLWKRDTFISGFFDEKNVKKNSIYLKRKYFLIFKIYLQIYYRPQTYEC